MLDDVHVIRRVRRHLDLERLLPGVRGAFECMEVAEEEIAVAKLRWPERAEALHGSFFIVRPTRGMGDFARKLYRHHCKELLGRVAGGQIGKALNLGTEAEVLVALHHTSLAVMLRSDALFVFERIFHSVFGLSFFEDELRESWDGAGDELLSEMRRKVRIERAKGLG